MLGVLTEINLMPFNKYRVKYFQFSMMFVGNPYQPCLVMAERNTVLVTIVLDKVEDIGQLGQLVGARD